MLFDPVIPQPILVDRGQVLGRALQRLSDDVLAAIIEGVERNLDCLETGRLFNEQGGGCVVGVTLKELYPSRYNPRRLRWFYQRRMKGIGWDHQIAVRHVRLRHVEIAFDRCVQMTKALRPELDEEEIIRAVGLWFIAEAAAERERRWRSRSLPATPHEDQSLAAQPEVAHPSFASRATQIAV